MTCTPEEVRAFIADATKAKEVWQKIADKSWDEIKKKRQDSRLWSITPNNLRQRARYPAWFSIFNIRKPLILARIGIPIGKDTTQDGSDNVGATAAMCLERLAKSLAKTFDYFDTLSYARDDYLATDFGAVRAYYERDEIKQEVKEYLQVQKGDNGQAIFTRGNGEIIDDTNTKFEILQDDEGFFIEHEETVDVEQERVCLEHVLYKHLYVDPDVRAWSRVRRIGFDVFFSEPEFIEVFGMAAFSKLPKGDDGGENGQPENTAKRQLIRVVEYWDWYEKRCYWLPWEGTDFVEPKTYYTPDNDEDYAADLDTRNGLYDLEKFFPMPKPLLTNQPTDEFWPVPEYHQLIDIINDIHNIFSRMFVVTKAIRARLLFDNNIDGLQAALNEAAEADAIGIPNLGQLLSGIGGNLSRVVQYIPVDQLINGLGQLYTALEQRLNSIYKLTGTSDLLQGLITDTTDRTLGERQMTEKYALNQIAERQRKMQEFVRDCYQLMTEIALKNFKDASLDQYIMPQTMPEAHQQNYRAALGLLKENNKRFRIDLETDSTIALNEDYDKKMRIELVNALTSAIEKTANIALNSPALVEVELHALKFLIQGMRQGKMFQAEITQAIDGVIQRAQDASKDGPPPFNKDEVAAQLRQREIDSHAATLQFKIMSNERIEMAKINGELQVQSLRNQIETFKSQVVQQKNFNELQLEYDKLRANIAEAQQALDIERDNLYVELRKITNIQEAEQFRLMIENNVASYERDLGVAAQQLNEYRTILDARERMAQEMRLEHEQLLEKVQVLHDMVTPTQPNINVTNEAAPPPEPLNVIRDAQGNLAAVTMGTKSVKFNRDEFGNLLSVEHQPLEIPEHQPEPGLLKDSGLVPDSGSGK